MKTKLDNEIDFDPDRNPAQSKYEEEFNKMVNSPENKALDDQIDAGISDGFRYTGDQDRDALLNAESSGSDITSSTSGTEKSSLLKSGGDGKIGKLSSIFKKASTKKKVLIAAGGLGGGGAIIALIFLIMFLSSGLGVRQLAQVLQTYNFARLHLANYKRSTQYALQESVEESTGGARLNALGRRSVLDRLSRFDAQKSLKTLGDADALTFNTGTVKNRWVRGPKQGITSITVGGQEIKLSQSSKVNFVGNYKNDKKLLKELDLAMQESSLFAEESRFYRTKTANAIMESANIRLSYWANKARKIKTFKDAILSAYERMTTRKLNSSLPPVEEGGEKFAKEFAEELDSTDDVTRAAAKASARSVGQSTIRQIAGKVSIAALVGTLYCGAKDYMTQLPSVAKNKSDEMMRGAALLSSAADQTANGDTTAEAVDAEVKRQGSFEESYAYQRAVGVETLSDKSEDIDIADSPRVDTDTIIYKFFAAIVAIVEGATGITALQGVAGWIPGVGDAVQDVVNAYIARVCKALNSNAGQLILAIGEVALQAAAAIPSGGTSAAASTGAKVGVETAVKLTFKESLKRFSLAFVKKGSVEVATQFGIAAAFNIFLEQLKGTSQPGTDDQRRLIGKQDAGFKLLSNQEGLQGGGRELSVQELGRLDQVTKERRTALLQKKSLWHRLASLDNPYSTGSQFAVSFPTGPSSLLEKTRQFAFKSLNPLASIANAQNRMAIATSSGSGLVYAVGGDEYNNPRAYGTISVGWSEAELAKMQEPSYWPRENARWVEQGRRLLDLHEAYNVCFETPLYLYGLNKVRDGRTVRKYCESAMKTEGAFRYRLYRKDGGLSDDAQKVDPDQGTLGQLIDLQNVSSTSPSGTDGGGGDSGGSNGELPSGDAQSLAQKILDTPNITFTTPLARAGIEAIAQGKPAAIEARCNAGSSTPISETLLGVMLKISESYAVGYGYITNGCHTSGSLHYKGRAADINTVNGRRATGGDSDRPFMQAITGILPDGSSMGEVNCSNIPINPINQVRLHTDSCNHIHIGVP